MTMRAVTYVLGVTVFVLAVGDCCTPAAARSPLVRQLTQSSGTTKPQDPQMSDDGSRAVYDDGSNVFVVDIAGGPPRGLTTVTTGECDLPYPDADASVVVMLCDDALGGRNDDGNIEVVVHRGAGLGLVTSSGFGVENDLGNLSGDGERIVFTSNGNYDGRNADGSYEVFLWSGGAIDQITDGTAEHDIAAINRSGTRLLVGRLEGDDAFSLFLYDIGTQVFTPVPIPDPIGNGSWSRNGEWLIFETPVDLTGSHPGPSWKLYRQRIGGEAELLLEMPTGQRASALTTDDDASTIAALISTRADDDEEEGEVVTGTPLLFIDGRQEELNIPTDAFFMSLDNAGRRLVFTSEQDPVGENPNRHAQLFVALLDETVPPTPTPTPRPPTPTPGPCYGDCDGGGSVTVDELIRGVNIALGNAALASCPPFDANRDGSVTVDELVRAVNAALNGCAGQPG